MMTAGALIRFAGGSRYPETGGAPAAASRRRSSTRLPGSLPTAADSGVGIKIKGGPAHRDPARFDPFSKRHRGAEHHRVRQGSHHRHCPAETDCITLAADGSNFTPSTPRLRAAPIAWSWVASSAPETIIGFDIPKIIQGSRQPAPRATLELTPAVPVPGLRRRSGAPAQVRGVLANWTWAPKSPGALGAGVPGGAVPADSTSVQLLEVFTIVAAWFGPGNTAPTTRCSLAITPEGGSFGRPEFFFVAERRERSRAPHHLRTSLATGTSLMRSSSTVLLGLLIAAPLAAQSSSSGFGAPAFR